MGDRRYIHWLEEISLDDIADVGGKSASLGEMYQSLVPRGIRIPNGFAVSVEAYRDLLDQANAWKPLRELLRYYAGSSDGQEIRAAEKACTLIYEAELPDELEREIVSSYVALCEQYGPQLRVAVRSSATAEDLPDASFSGQYDRFLNIGDKEGLLDACRSCFASLFTERAISYREHHELDHFKVYLAIVVMKMVRADLAASGVMFTLDTENGYRDVIFINSAFGLGDSIVQGAGIRYSRRSGYWRSESTERRRDGDPSSDLTQLVLGVDRGSDIVASDFDERDPGVPEMLRLAVEVVHNQGIPAGICGEAPSNYPEVVEYLVQLGIDSINLSPDALLRTTEKVSAIARGRHPGMRNGTIEYDYTAACSGGRPAVLRDIICIQPPGIQNWRNPLHASAGARGYLSQHWESSCYGRFLAHYSPSAIPGS